MVKIIIPLEPVAKAYIKDKQGNFHLTPACAIFETAVGWYVKGKMPELLDMPKPIKVVVTHWLTEPKRSKYDHPVGKPDIDNLDKSVNDGCKGVLWHDDSQILDKHSRKLWAKKGYIELEVTEWTS